MSKKKASKKRDGCGVYTIGIVIAVLVLSIIVTGVIFLGDITGLNGEDVDCVVEIPSGSGSANIAKVLHSRGIIEHPFMFKVYTKLTGEPAYQKGRHTLNPSMSYGELIKKLESYADADEGVEKRVVIPEGYELTQIVDLLVEKGLGSRETFMNEIENGRFDYDFVNQITRTENRLEGYLYPETYQFSVNQEPYEIINTMLKTFNDRVLPVYNEISTPYSLDQIVTMASVIEREAANDEERPKVSSVFFNRLNIGMKLESCATVQYIIKERKDILTNADIAIDSPYNTYMYEGMPKGPIASPGLNSIKAALTPAETDYLYFLATANGEQNLFSETFEEHNRKIIEIQGE